MAANTIKITLRSSDNQEFEVDEAVAMEFGTIKTFFDDNLDASIEPIPLPNVSSKCLSTIIKYCKFHLGLRSRDHSSLVADEAKAYDDELVDPLDNESLIELALATHYLDVKDMLDMINQGIADRIKNKSVEYVRKLFGIENDYTPEEEAEMRAQYEWAFEGVDPDED
ncbi:nuclear transcription factor Y subunit C-2-like isoform X1 [Hibiscus syriacus]|uniref:SKP1-like protein n=1 Tax=Hibiscus syriacus TaxID=106335 RepID=A0A6A3A4H9_HIBSY|nr:SKP1-like protein 14 [Hibiscus syriacus]KAE8699108.1 nuclear transcription factor Y subunit C-2-like isoform X1 [Hibiscus syriacus]